MNLDALLSDSDVSVVVDGKISLRAASEDSMITVKTLRAEDPSQFLSLALADPVAPLAAITDSGRLYVLSQGLRGVVRVQGSSANKSQKATLEKLARALYEHDGLMLPDYYAPKLDPKKIVKEHVVPEETFAEPSADPVAQVDDSTPTE
jgi:hypothetical protein